MDNKQEYKAFNNRINEAFSMAALQRLERSLSRLFDNGIFTPAQFTRLDLKIMDRMI